MAEEKKKKASKKAATGYHGGSVDTVISVEEGLRELRRK